MYYDSCLLIGIYSHFLFHYKFRHYCTTVVLNISNIFTNYSGIYESDLSLALKFMLKLHIRNKTKLKCGFIKLFSADILIRPSVISC